MTCITFKTGRTAHRWSAYQNGKLTKQIRCEFCGTKPNFGD